MIDTDTEDALALVLKIFKIVQFISQILYCWIQSNSQQFQQPVLLLGYVLHSSE
jgi:hypothetical protein